MVTAGRPGEFTRARLETASLPGRTLNTAQLLARAESHLHRFDRAANVDAAITELNEVVGKEPSNAAAYAMLSRAYGIRQSANPDPQWRRLALDTAQKSVQLAPGLAVSHLALGAARADMGDVPGAVRELTRAVELDAANGIAHLQLARPAAKQNDNRRAEESFRKAVELSPENWWPLLSRGSWLYSVEIQGGCQ